MKIFITDTAGDLRQVEGESVVIMLDNGRTLEITPELNPSAQGKQAVIWGGRVPKEGMTIETLKKQTERLILSPSAANCVSVRPGE